MILIYWDTQSCINKEALVLLNQERSNVVRPSELKWLAKLCRFRQNQRKKNKAMSIKEKRR